MYRTGDLGRWLAGCSIEYVGLNDFQVKVRGYRIELGEIESRLAQVEGVREAVVVAREATAGDRRLVAYYTAVAPLPAEELRGQMSRVLPEYMLPAAYVYLERYPLTPSGKLDRKALPAPDADAYAARGYEAPQGETETALAEIWAELLNHDRASAMITSSNSAATPCSLSPSSFACGKKACTWMCTPCLPHPV